MRRQAGYIAVMATLIVGAISLAVVSSVLLIGTGAQQNQLVTQQAAQSRGGVSGCVEEALLQIQSNTAYTGTANLTIAESACSYTVTNTGSTTRTITATATVGNVVKKAQVYVTIGSSSISVTLWQEVS